MAPEAQPPGAWQEGAEGGGKEISGEGMRAPGTTTDMRSTQYPKVSVGLRQGEGGVQNASHVVRGHLFTQRALCSEEMSARDAWAVECPPSLNRSQSLVSLARWDALPAEIWGLRVAGPVSRLGGGAP